MKKRILAGLLAVCMLCGLAACGKAEATWQEQYDLGVRYLAEGNYQEAILAFEAAIEIDPARPEAYGRLADVYLAMDDPDMAAQVLSDGVAATGDAELQVRLAELSAPGPGTEPGREPAPEASREPAPMPTYTASGICGDGVWWGYDAATGTLTIGGSGAMEDYSYGEAPWSDYAEAIRTAVVENGVTQLGSYAFLGCTSLTSVTLSDSVVSIGDWAFSGCRSLAGITLPGAVTSIGAGAFQACTSLVSATLPGSVTSIGYQAFYACISLSAITIPGSMTSIELQTFACCDSLASVTIPSSVTSIGYGAFEECYGLASVYYTGTYEQWTAISIDNSDGGNNCLLNAATYCSSGASVPDPTPEGAYTDSGSCGDNTWWGYDERTRTLTIGGSGRMDDYDFDFYTGPTAPWSAYADTIKSLELENGVTHLGAYAFSFCSGLTSVTIPNSVISIGDDAFQFCSGLTSVTVPGSVTSIEAGAFQSCVSLTSITIPDSVARIEDSAFQGCSGLTSVTIPGSVTSIRNYAFAFCPGLTSVTISGGVISIGSSAFFQCTGLTGITIPDSVTGIEYGAFSECSSLTDVYYTGTQAQWEAISIDNYNESNAPLLDATVHYNSPG